MGLGFISNWGKYYTQNLIDGSKKAVQASGQSGGVQANESTDIHFKDFMSAKYVQGAAGQENVSGLSFKERWQNRFPGGYYHVMDAYKIPQGTWQRTDFPFEKFFAEKVDESVQDWKPVGTAPLMSDAKVQSRLDSVLGQHSIVVPPALEEKLKTDPDLADKVMANIDYLFKWNGYPIPGRINSALIVLDENGEVARWNLISGGGGISGPTEEEQRQFELEQKAKKERRAEYARINEESALKRKLREEERNRQYYEESTAKSLAMSSVYQKRMWEARCSMTAGALAGNMTSVPMSL